MEMNLVMPNNYVELEQEEMMYVDGGAYINKWDCQKICIGLGLTGQGLMMGAFAAVIVKKALKIFKAGGPLGWIVGIVGGAIAGAIGRVLYCIGYGSLVRGCDINWSPYPWEAFVNASVR